MRSTFLFLLTCCTVWAAQSQSQININTQIAGYFPFDTCALVDASGVGNVGNLSGTVQCVCGVRDNALQFDEDEKAIVAGTISTVFSTSNFTISFYMKPEDAPSPGATQIVMSKQDSCKVDNSFWVRYRKQGQTPQTSNILSVGMYQNDTLGVTLSTKLPSSRCWYHVVIVRDGTKHLLYIDGVLRNQKNTAFRLDLSNPANLQLSGPKCTTDDSYYGLLDEMRFYNRAYSQEEIGDLLALYPDKLINQDTLLYLGKEFTALLSPTCAPTVLWTPNTGISDPTIVNPVISPLMPTTYVVRFNHEDGCVAYDSIFVNLIDPDTLDCSKLFIPNAFTPGFSSGRNDQFFISNSFVLTDFISFEIFDRWGGRVFNADSAEDAWDGTFGGQPANPGMFLYRVRYRCKGIEKVQSGTVTLLR